MESAMRKLFTAVKPALWAVDAVIARAILLLWISTLQAQLRHGREPRH
jgi:hypothetical protein